MLYYLHVQVFQRPILSVLPVSPRKACEAGNLVVVHCLFLLFEGAWGKEKPEQMHDSFDTYPVDCPVIVGSNKTILI